MATNDGTSVQVIKSSEGITTITLSRSHVRNAVNASTAAELYAAFIDFENDQSQLVAVFHGANATFCAGFDLHELSASGDRPRTGNSVETVTPGRNQGPMGPSRLQVRKPVIAAIAGYAVAGGLELSLLADMRIVEEDAVFGVFCRRWGVPLIDGGTVRLQRIVGLGRALDMILTGRPVGAREALSMGLASRIVPKGQSLEVATALAKTLAKFPQGCMNVDRTNTYYAAYDAQSFEDALAHEYVNGSKIVALESVKGAGMFSKGAGRHGGFSL